MNEILSHYKSKGIYTLEYDKTDKPLRISSKISSCTYKKNSSNTIDVYLKMEFKIYFLNSENKIKTTSFIFNRIIKKVILNTLINNINKQNLEILFSKRSKLYCKYIKNKNIYLLNLITDFFIIERKFFKYKLNGLQIIRNNNYKNQKFNFTPKNHIKISNIKERFDSIKQIDSSKKSLVDIKYDQKISLKNNISSLDQINITNKPPSDLRDNYTISAKNTNKSLKEIKCIEEPFIDINDNISTKEIDDSLSEINSKNEHNIYKENNKNYLKQLDNIKNLLTNINYDYNISIENTDDCSKEVDCTQELSIDMTTKNTNEFKGTKNFEFTTSQFEDLKNLSFYYFIDIKINGKEDITSRIINTNVDVSINKLKNYDNSLYLNGSIQIIIDYITEQNVFQYKKFFIPLNTIFQLNRKIIKDFKLFNLENLKTIIIGNISDYEEIPNISNMILIKFDFNNLNIHRLD